MGILAALVAMFLLVMLIIAKLKEADAHEEKLLEKDSARRKSMFKVQPVGRESNSEEKQKQTPMKPASGETVLPASMEALADLGASKKRGREKSEEMEYGRGSRGKE